MNTAELIYQRAKEIPEYEAREVLDFMERLQAKRERDKAQAYSATCEQKHDAPTMTPDEAKALCAELQALVESQPMQTESAGDFIRRMRDKARC
jgi:DNA topoisomerase IA